MTLRFRNCQPTTTLLGWSSLQGKQWNQPKEFSIELDGIGVVLKVFKVFTKFLEKNRRALLLVCPLNRENSYPKSVLRLQHMETGIHLQMVRKDEKTMYLICLSLSPVLFYVSHLISSTFQTSKASKLQGIHTLWFESYLNRHTPILPWKSTKKSPPYLRDLAASSSAWRRTA